jgi:hypothetical protein
MKDADWFSGTREVTGECRHHDASPNIEDHHFYYPSSRVPALTPQR